MTAFPGLLALAELLAGSDQAAEEDTPMRPGGMGTNAGSAASMQTSPGLGSASQDPVLAGGGDPIYGGLFGLALDQLQARGGGGGGGGGAGPQSGPLRTVNDVTMIAPAIRELRQAKRQLGLPIFGNVVSSYRTRAQQAELYRRYKAGTGNLAAPPGQSNHETGHAVDISSSFLANNPKLRKWLLAHGWTNDVPGEPWHWEYG